MKKTVKIVLLILCTALLIFSVYKLTSELISYKTGRDSYASLMQYVSFDMTGPQTPPTTEDTDSADAPSEKPTDSTSASGETEEPEPTEDTTVWPRVDFEKLAQINPDVVGWICIEGTNVNYPIVQTSDNDYYLYRMFDGTYNSAGCIFLDAYCSSDFSGQNNVIYGHHMNDGSMFANLVKYKEQKFFDEHPEALLVTPTGNYKIRFFAGYVSDVWGNAWDKAFDTGSFGDWLTEVTGKSCFTSSVVPTEFDSVLTLSTCSYEFDSAKFVIHGVIET